MQVEEVEYRLLLDVYTAALAMFKKHRSQQQGMAL